MSDTRRCADFVKVTVLSVSPLFSFQKGQLNYAAPVFTTGELTVDLTRRQVTVGGREVQVTPTEYDLLRTLVAHAGKVLPTGNCCAKCGAQAMKPRRTCSAST